MTITIQPNSLKAISLATSKEDARYYLNGVFIEIFEEGGYSLIATDGHRLYGWDLQKEATPATSYILASKDIDIVLKMAETFKKAHKKEADSINIHLTFGEGTIHAAIFSNELELWKTTCKPIDGTFPQWRRVAFVTKHAEELYKLTAPDTYEGLEVTLQEPFALHSAYLADLDKLARCFGKSCAVMLDASAGAGQPITLSIAKQPLFHGIIMPMRWNACN